MARPNLTPVEVELKRTEFDAWNVDPASPVGPFTPGAAATLCALLGAQGDLCADPRLFVVTGEAGARTATETFGRRDGQIAVGGTLTQEWLRTHRALPSSSEERRRLDMAYAHAGALRYLGASGELRERSGGFPPLLAAATVVIGVGIVSYAVNHAVRYVVDANHQQELRLLQRAGQEYTEQLRYFRTNGTMPPPGPAQQAASAIVGSYANDARNARWPLEAAKSAGKWLGIGLAFGGLVLLSKSGGSGE